MGNIKEKNSKELSEGLKVSFFEYTLQDFKEFLKTHSLSPFVADQCFDWVYKKHVLSPFDMRNISKKNQAFLNDHVDFALFKDVTTIVSKEENAIKSACLDQANE